MSRYWDWQIGLRHIDNHLKQLNVVPPRLASGTRFEREVTSKFCKTKSFKGSFTERILFIVGDKDVWKEFTAYCRENLRKMPEFKAGDQLTFTTGVIVQITSADPPENPKKVSIRPVDCTTNIGSAPGGLITIKVHRLPKIKFHYRPATLC